MLRYIDAVRVFHGKTVAKCGLTQQQYCCLANALALSFFVTGILLRIILICGTFCILITPVCSMRVERVEPLGFFVALSFFVTGIKTGSKSAPVL